MVTVDFTDEFIRNKFRGEFRNETLSSLEAMQEAGHLGKSNAVSELFQKTFLDQIMSVIPKEKRKALAEMKIELKDEKLGALLDRGTIHYILRKFDLEGQVRDAISFADSMDASDKITVKSFQLKILTLKKEDDGLKIDNIRTALHGEYVDEVPLSQPWRF